MEGKQLNLSEDWLAVYIGLGICALSFVRLFGKDVLGWAVATSVWTNALKALGPASDGEARAPIPAREVNMRDASLQEGDGKLQPGNPSGRREGWSPPAAPTGC